MNAAEQPNSEISGVNNEVFPEPLLSAVGVLPEIEAIMHRIKRGERTLHSRSKKFSLRERVINLVGRGSVFLTQGRFVDFKYSK